MGHPRSNMGTYFFANTFFFLEILQRTIICVYYLLYIIMYIVCIIMYMYIVYIQYTYYAVILSR